MLQNLVHEQGEVRTYTLPAAVSCARGQPLDSAGAIAPTDPRHGACLLLDHAQPCAGWMRARAMLPWTNTQGSLAPPSPPASGLPRPDSHGPRFGRQASVSTLDTDERFTVSARRPG
jgi:hypothetical protein